MGSAAKPSLQAPRFYSNHARSFCFFFLSDLYKELSTEFLMHPPSQFSPEFMVLGLSKIHARVSVGAINANLHFLLSLS